MTILINQLGYDSKGTKWAVYQGKEEDGAGHFSIRSEDGTEVFAGEAKESGTVANWKRGYYWTLDFTELSQSGTYRIYLKTNTQVVISDSFEVEEYLVTMRLINAANYYFKAQRSSGEWLEEDKHVRFRGEREGRMDVHGGWYDATGDYGVHLSHLSHGSVHNPQQAAFSAYAFFKAAEWLEESGNIEYTMIKRRMLDEGCWGADFLMRLRAPSGSLIRSVNRGKALDHVRDNREISFEYHGSSTQFSQKAATADEESITDENYEVSLRSGGGTAIAALAIASRYYYPGTDYSRDEYLNAAKDAWHYLAANNERYTNDGEWNLLDEYCSLLALTELYRASGEYEYLCEAGTMAERIYDRAREDRNGNSYLTSIGEQPFFHASDEGLAVIGLLEYAKVELDGEKADKARLFCEKMMRGVLERTEGVNNPFGYPRMLVKAGAKEEKEQFFFPHDTSVAPWWQGDNARILSLSAAARNTARVVSDEKLAERLNRFADNQINWIMGLNPFESCMMEGYGKNNVEYFFGGRYDFINCPGGICNGITSGLEDEEGIELIRKPCEAIQDNWRWAEQWIPHVSWFICAETAKRI